MSQEDFAQQGGDVATPSGNHRWIGYAAVVVALACVALALIALAEQWTVLALAGFIAAVVLFALGAFVLLHHSEEPDQFDRGMSLSRRPRGRSAD